MNENEKRMYEIFEELNITDYEVTNHVAVKTIEEVDKFGLSMEGLNVKNLLIRDKKTEKYYMVIIEEHKQVDMKKFKELTGWKKNSFAGEEDLAALLNLHDGGVTPLALFNDTEKRITVVLGVDITKADDSEKIGFHPCRTDGTLTMRVGDFKKFLAHIGSEVIWEN